MRNPNYVLPRLSGSPKTARERGVYAAICIENGFQDRFDAVGILLCPAAGSKSCGNTGLDRTFQPGRVLSLNSNEQCSPTNRR